MKGFFFQTSKKMRIKVDPPAGKTITTFVVTEINGQKTSVHTRHDGLRVCVSWSILWLDVRLLVLSWHDIAHVDMFTGRVVSTHYCRLVWKSRPTITTSNPTQGEKNKQTPQKSSFGKILIESWMNQKKTQRKRNSKLNCVILSTPKFRLFPFLVFSFIWDSHETCQ